MGRLRGIPAVLSPDILHLLAITGHGDEIVLADINFPTNSICSAPGGPKMYRADGVNLAPLLEGILTLMPLDKYSQKPVTRMSLVKRDIDNVSMDHWKEYERIIEEAYKKEDHRTICVGYLERFDFYERAKKAYAIIQTGETLPYSNVVLVRGVC